MTCSHRSCVPNARRPRMCVTVFASQPSVSMETETTQRMAPPSCPGLPTVFMTSRSSSWSEMLSPACASPAAFDYLPPKALNLVGRHRSEVIVKCITSFELLAVDRAAYSVAATGCRWPRRNYGTVCVGHSADVVVPSAFFRWNPDTKVIDQLRDCGVLANNDEAGWRFGCQRLLPEHQMSFRNGR